MGNQLENVKSAVEYLQSEDRDNLKAVDNIMSFNKRTPTVKTEVKTEGHQWEEDDTVPEGWKVRRVPQKDNTELEFFLTEAGKQINGRRPAIDFALKEDYDEDTVNALMKGLKKFGWEVDLNFPSGFLKRTVQKQSRGSQVLLTEFLTPDNKKCHSYCELLEYLINEGSYDDEVVSYCARQINWGKLSGERKEQLQSLMKKHLNFE